eukprot:jgi/Antlo1/2559/1873
MSEANSFLTCLSVGQCTYSKRHRRNIKTAIRPVNLHFSKQEFQTR